MSAIELKEICGQEVYVHVIDGRKFVRLEEVEQLLSRIAEQQQEEDLPKEESVETHNRYYQKNIIVNKKRFTAWFVDEIPYLNLTQAAFAKDGSTAGITQRANRIEAERKAELEEKKAKEVADTGHSDINPEKDSLIRHDFNFQRRHKFISVPDLERYFFSMEK